MARGPYHYVYMDYRHKKDKVIILYSSVCLQEKELLFKDEIHFPGFEVRVVLLDGVAAVEAEEAEAGALVEGVGTAGKEDLDAGEGGGRSVFFGQAVAVEGAVRFLFFHWFVLSVAWIWQSRPSYFLIDYVPAATVAGEAPGVG